MSTQTALGHYYPSVLQRSSGWKHYKPEPGIGWQPLCLIRSRFLKHMVPLDKTPRARRGNVVFPAYESGLEAPVSLLVFHLNRFYCITVNCCGDRQLFRLCFDVLALSIQFFTQPCVCNCGAESRTCTKSFKSHGLSTTALLVTMSPQDVVNEIH